MKPVILVIDDNPKVAESLHQTLSEYEFLAAADGETGLRILKNPHVVDLVILDYKLGDQSGLDVLTAIRKIDPAMKVIILTSFGNKQVAVQALRSRADDFVDKPWEQPALKSRIEALLEARRRAFEENSDHDKVGKVVELLRRNYKKDVTLDYAAGLVALTPKYLSRKFREVTGRGFSEHKSSVRIDRARELLRDSASPVNKIAEAVGYENAESFVKVFKKSAGMTPTEYRVQAQGLRRALPPRA